MVPAFQVLVHTVALAARLVVVVAVVAPVEMSGTFHLEAVCRRKTSVACDQVEAGRLVTELGPLKSHVYISVYVVACGLMRSNIGYGVQNIFQHRLTPSINYRNSLKS